MGDATALLDRYGYLAVAVLVLIEDFGIPVPGETVLILAAVSAGAGHLDIVVVAAVAWLAAVVGDNTGYAIGRFGGRRLIHRYGRYVLLTPARFARAEAVFTRYGGWIVVVARFIEGLRQLNGIVAGSTAMHWARFLIANAIGAALWVGTWATLGYLFGDRIEQVRRIAGRYVWYLVAAAAVLLVVLVVVRVRRHRRRPPPDEPPPPAGG